MALGVMLSMVRSRSGGALADAGVSWGAMVLSLFLTSKVWAVVVFAVAVVMPLVRWSIYSRRRCDVTPPLKSGRKDRHHPVLYTPSDMIRLYGTRRWGFQVAR